MKKLLLISLPVMLLLGSQAKAQNIKTADVPATVKSALMQKYPKAAKVTWEKEKGNYEANWGGKSGEDLSVQYTPKAEFVEQVQAIPVTALPQPVAAYVKQHYNGAKITEAGKVTDAKGQNFFEAEIKGKDLIFDEKGNFVKVD